MKHIILFISLLIAFSVNAIKPDWALYGVKGREFHEGLSESYSTENHLHGYINAGGDIVIHYIYKYNSSFSRGTAKVTDQEGKQGIINIEGNYTLTPGDYDIYTFDNVPGYYKIRRKLDNKSAVFDGRKFLTGFDFDYIDFYQTFPMLSLSSSGDGPRAVMNVLTGEYMPDRSVSSYGSVGYLVSHPNEDPKLYDFEGEPIDLQKLKISSKGNELYFDENTDLCGIRNAKTKQIVCPPKYKLNRNQEHMTIWRNDVVMLFDSISPDLKYAGVIVNQDGKEILRETSPGIKCTIDRDFIYSNNLNDWSNYSLWKYYDFDGKEIKQLSGYFWIPVSNGIYRSEKDGLLYFSSNNQIRKDMYHPQYSDGTIIYANKSMDKWYIYNIEQDKLSGPYDGICDNRGFNEGIIVCRRNDENFLVDKNGKEYHYPKDIRIEGSFMSEGVIAAYDNVSYTNGFLYNPLGHDGWNYNQTGGDLRVATYKKLSDKARDLFNDGKYAQAMDVLSQIMELYPEDKASFNNYARCLYNLGMYDEALTAVDVSLSHWEDDELTLNLKNDIVAAIEEQQKRDSQESTEQETYSPSVWDVLGSFSNAMMQMAGQTSGYYTPQYSLSGPSDSQNYGGGGKYESQYRNWERRAQQCYQSLTNTGYSTTSKSGRKHGGTGQGMSSGNYVQMKRSLREAQREMRSIRMKAAREGVTIAQSQWENASVGY